MPWESAFGALIVAVVFFFFSRFAGSIQLTYEVRSLGRLCRQVFLSTLPQIHGLLTRVSLSFQILLVSKSQMQTKSVT